MSGKKKFRRGKGMKPPKPRASGKPGKGKGSGPSIWGEETKKNDAKFKTKKAKGKVGDPEKSQVLRKQRQRAINQSPGEGSTPQGGGTRKNREFETNSRRISPRYHPVIKQYFKSNDDK